MRDDRGGGGSGAGCGRDGERARRSPVVHKLCAGPSAPESLLAFLPAGPPFCSPVDSPLLHSQAAAIWQGMQISTWPPQQRQDTDTCVGAAGEGGCSQVEGCGRRVRADATRRHGRRHGCRTRPPGCLPLHARCFVMFDVGLRTRLSHRLEPRRRANQIQQRRGGSRWELGWGAVVGGVRRVAWRGSPALRSGHALTQSRRDQLNPPEYFASPLLPSRLVSPGAVLFIPLMITCVGAGAGRHAQQGCRGCGCDAQPCIFRLPPACARHICRRATLWALAAAACVPLPPLLRMPPMPPVPLPLLLLRTCELAHACERAPASACACLTPPLPALQDGQWHVDGLHV